MVRPHLEHANAVWGPFNKADQKRIKRVQRRATKLVANICELPYEARLQSLNLPSLYYSCLRGDTITVYQVLHGGVDVDVSQLFTRAAMSLTHGSSPSPGPPPESDETLSA